MGDTIQGLVSSIQGHEDMIHSMPFCHFQSGLKRGSRRLVFMSPLQYLMMLQPEDRLLFRDG